MFSLKHNHLYFILFCVSVLVLFLLINLETNTFSLPITYAPVLTVLSEYTIVLVLLIVIVIPAIEELMFRAWALNYKMYHTVILPLLATYFFFTNSLFLAISTLLASVFLWYFRYEKNKLIFSFILSSILFVLAHIDDQSHVASIITWSILSLFFGWSAFKLGWFYAFGIHAFWNLLVSFSYLGFFNFNANNENDCGLTNISIEEVSIRESNRREVNVETSSTINFIPEVYTIILNSQVYGTQQIFRSGTVRTNKVKATVPKSLNSEVIKKEIFQHAICHNLSIDSASYPLHRLIIDTVNASVRVSNKTLVPMTYNSVVNHLNGFDQQTFERLNNENNYRLFVPQKLIISKSYDETLRVLESMYRVDIIEIKDRQIKEYVFK